MKTMAGKAFRGSLAQVALGFIFTSLIVSAGFAGTFIVANGQSIQDQLNTLAPGDTLLVRAGNYSEGLSLPTSGTAGKPIVLMAYPGERPVIQSDKQLFSLNKSHWVIDGFILDHNNAANDAIRVTSSASFITVRNCEIRFGQRDAFDISGGAKDITIENNVIHDFVWAPGKDAHGIVTNPGATRISILNNTIYNCGGDCIQLFASNSDPVSAYSKEIVIKGNRFYTTLGSDSENALDFKGVDGAVVENNEMYGFENKAMVVQKGCRNLTVVGNVVHDSQRGMEFRGEGGKTQANHVIRRNVLYNIAKYYAVKFDGVENVEFVNNTIAFVSATALRVEGVGITGGRFQNNIFYQADKPSIKATFDVKMGHNGWFGLSGGSMAAGGDVSGSDPGFVNAAQFDFHLQAGSPAIDQGVDVGLPYQGAAPDLGAFEYGQGTTAVQLVNFSASAEGNRVQLNWKTAVESGNLGFSVERSRDGKTYRSIGFVRASTQNSGGQAYQFLDKNLQPGYYYYRLRQLDFDGTFHITDAIKVLVSIPQGYLLEQNSPNPFALSHFASTRISFFLPSRSSVRLRIYNILGQELKLLQSGPMNAGRHVIAWDGKDRRGQRISPGLYFYELQAGQVHLVRRLAVIR